MLWCERDREFHSALYRACGLPCHLEAIHAALDKSERYLVDPLLLTLGMRCARAEHQATLEAFEVRNARLAAKLTREHILGALGMFCGYMDSHPAAVECRRQPRPHAKGSAGSKIRVASSVTCARPWMTGSTASEGRPARGWAARV